MSAPEPCVSLVFADALSHDVCPCRTCHVIGHHWVCNFAVGQFFDYARVQWGAAGIFAFFGAMCAVAVLFIKSSVPETKGRSLEEVQAMLA